jgi:hypothetical protein
VNLNHFSVIFITQSIHSREATVVFPVGLFLYEALENV